MFSVVAEGGIHLSRKAQKKWSSVLSEAILQPTRSESDTVTVYMKLKLHSATHILFLGNGWLFLFGAMPGILSGLLHNGGLLVFNISIGASSDIFKMSYTVFPPLAEKAKGPCSYWGHQLDKLSLVWASRCTIWIQI